VGGTKAESVKCVILQPSYIPWRGYFDLIHRADVFVFYDDVQYDKHGWRNRNRVKTANGTQWLTIPVLSKGNVERGLLLNQIQINWTSNWARKHIATLRTAYGKAPFFRQYEDLIASFYEEQPTYLAPFTIQTTLSIARVLGINDTRFIRSSELSIIGKKTERLLAILRQIGASHYISGPSAREYIDEDAFNQAGITLEYVDYRYPEYEQLYPPYDPQVSILDLLFMKGPAAHEFIWGSARR
jgi:hypothetical protein